jgi:hypothetical protein
VGSDCGGQNARSNQKSQLAHFDAPLPPLTKEARRRAARNSPRPVEEHDRREPDKEGEPDSDGEPGDNGIADTVT